MKIKICLMAGILGMAIAAGVFESLSARRDEKKQQGEEAAETTE